MRRSSRTVPLAKKASKEKLLQQNIEDGVEDGLTVVECGAKGRGVQASKVFPKGEYVCTYKGELIPQKTAVER